MSPLFFWLWGVLGLAHLDTGADGAVYRCEVVGAWCTEFLIEVLLVLGVDEWVVAVLASEDLIRHEDILYFVE